MSRRVWHNGPPVHAVPAAQKQSEQPAKQRALCWNKARDGVVCDECNASMSMSGLGSSTTHTLRGLR